MRPDSHVAASHLLVNLEYRILLYFTTISCVANYRQE